MLDNAEISNLFQKTVEEYIKTLSYNDIRQYCLLHEPIAGILKTFSKELDSLVHKKKAEVGANILLGKSREQLEKEQKQIDKEHDNYSSLAYKECYEKFLFILKHYLKTRSHLTNAQGVALNKIINHMENYLAAQKELQDEARNKEDLKKHKQQIENEITAKERVANNLIAQQKELKKREETLKDQQENVKKVLENYAKRANKFAISAIFPFVFSILYCITSIFIMGLTCSPWIAANLLFILIPTPVTFLIGVGLIITSIAYLWKHLQEQENWNKNETLIQSNTTQIKSVNDDIELAGNDITLMKNQIGNLEKALSNIEKAEQALQEAEQINVISDHSQNFMPPPPESQKPPLSEEEEEEELNTSKEHSENFACQ